MRTLLPLLVMALAGSMPALASPVASVPAPTPAETVVARFDGASEAAFEASRKAIEAGMGDAQKLAFRMRLAEVRNKLAEQRGHHLGDAEFAAALDGKTLAELDAMADAAPARIQIDIETSDDT